MKKALSFLLTVLVLASSFTVSYATEQGVLTVNNNTAKAGDSVIVSVSITENPGIIAMKLSIHYDSSVMKLKSVSNGTVFSENAALFGNDLTAIPYSVLWEDSLSLKNITKTGKLLELKFEVLSGAKPGQYPVTVTYDTGSTFDCNLNDVGFKISSGSITVQGNESKPSNTDCSHQKTKWQESVKATCTTSGSKQKICTSCGKVLDTEYISAIGHKMGSWQVKTAATQTVEGVEERNCEHCSYKESRKIPMLKSDEITTQKAQSIISESEITTQVNSSADNRQPEEKSTGENNSVSEASSSGDYSETLATDDEKTTQKRNTSNNNKKIIVLSISGVLIVLLITTIFIVILKRKKAYKS